MDLRKYPGENVLQFCSDSLDKVDEIRLASQSVSDIEDLTQLAIHGCFLESDEGLRDEVRALVKQACQPGSTLTPELAVKALTENYEMATTKKTYGPMKDSSPPAAF